MLKLVVTKDGSHTLFNEELNEHYHSTFGAIQESKHIFIEAGLKYQLNKFNQINLLEVGFGTGLNVLLSFDQSTSVKNIEYWGIEAYPVTDDLISNLNYGEILKSEFLTSTLKKIHKAEWNKEIALSLNFKLHKKWSKIEDAVLPNNYFNLVYFDAFAPDVQSELWTVDVFKKLYESMTENGILVTYSVKGVVKRALKSAGFKIEKLPGPIGKREILRAMKPIFQE